MASVEYPFEALVLPRLVHALRAHRFSSPRQSIGASGLLAEPVERGARRSPSRRHVAASYAGPPPESAPPRARWATRWGCAARPPPAGPGTARSPAPRRRASRRRSSPPALPGVQRRQPRLRAALGEHVLHPGPARGGGPHLGAPLQARVAAAPAAPPPRGCPRTARRRAACCAWPRTAPPPAPPGGCVDSSRGEADQLVDVRVAPRTAGPPSL